MGDSAPIVQVELAWLTPPQLTVDHVDGRIVAQAHVGLSEAQVARACAELGDVGPHVLGAWREAVRA